MTAAMDQTPPDASSSSWTFTSVPDDARTFVESVRSDADLVALDVQGMTEVEVYKFLVANKGDEAAARARIRATLEWRRDFNFASIATEDFGDLEASGKFYALPHPTTTGRTVHVWRSRLHMPDPPSLPRLVRFMIRQVYFLWRQGRAADRIVLLVSRDGASPKHRDLAMAKEVAATFNAHFPEILDELYVYPGNWLTTVIWAVVRPFLDPATAEKVNFVADRVVRDRLAQLLPPEHTPTALGGTWTGEPVGIDPEVVLKARLDEAVTLP
ncbi:hypothetical protein H9P43_006741 [Blastocladiella emersonii ATCC 22665]|nr:hypothetical protein H9P43_006741 [Blastocladiella emersonii ATCC 22665]